ncbi:MAG: hypothetical protein LBT62_07960 [Deltaproteobacteria bacterium]|jgi:hypothetical protein|nr:hypothetical protein [Deltaproteobacteria bacterium]
MEEDTSNSCLAFEPYALALPSNIDVFSSLNNDSLAVFKDDEAVLEQVKQVLRNIYLGLQAADKLRPIRTRLSRLCLVRLEDEAALLEWNFQDFRVGFSLEPDKTQSCYYIVSQDKSVGSFFTYSQRLGADNMAGPVETLVKYVLANAE